VATTDDPRASERITAVKPRDAETRDAGVESEQFKYTRFDDSPGSTHNLVVDLVPENSQVLEFGCATGYMSEVLVRRRRCRVTGIEIDAMAAAEARAYCERIIVGDAETLDLEEQLGENTYNAVLFADVLEHLRDPVVVLKRVRPFVAEGGAVIASIPNVAHISVRLALLGGEFRYRGLGLLDDTHLRFFTRASIVELFESAGFVVSTWHRRRIEQADAEISPPPDLPEAVGAWLGSDPELTTYQFVVRAIPSDAASQLAETRAALRRAEDELEEARADVERLEELEGMSRELDLMRRAHEAQGRHLVSERLAFAERIGQLDDAVETLREEVEWRKGVMEEYERQLARIHGSRAYRYATSVRRMLRGRRG
jgi:O-antigen biosynthesis protein